MLHLEGTPTTWTFPPRLLRICRWLVFGSFPLVDCVFPTFLWVKHHESELLKDLRRCGGSFSCIIHCASKGNLLGSFSIYAFPVSQRGIACRIPPIPAVPVVLAVCPFAPQIINGAFEMDVPMLLRDIVMSPAPSLNAKKLSKSEHCQFSSSASLPEIVQP